MTRAEFEKEILLNIIKKLRRIEAYFCGGADSINSNLTSRPQKQKFEGL